MEECKSYHNVKNVYNFLPTDGSATCNDATENACWLRKADWLAGYEEKGYTCVYSADTKLGNPGKGCTSALEIENYTCTKAAQ